MAIACFGVGAGHMSQKLSRILMLSFIALVIVASLFGPWGISLILGSLAAACAVMA